MQAVILARCLGDRLSKGRCFRLLKTESAISCSSSLLMTPR